MAHTSRRQGVVRPPRQQTLIHNCPQILPHPCFITLQARGGEAPPQSQTITPSRDGSFSKGAKGDVTTATSAAATDGAPNLIALDILEGTMFGRYGDAREREGGLLTVHHSSSYHHHHIVLHDLRT